MTTDNRDLMAVAKSLDEWGISYTELPRLAQDTPRTEVRQRQGPGGKTLDYVDARYVMKVLDNVIGPENWQRQHAIGDGGKVACGIGILIAGIGWVWKWDGAGETDIEGEKGSFSDAFKRAAVSWGIARDLYPDATNNGSVMVAKPSASSGSAPFAASAEAGAAVQRRPAAASYDDTEAGDPDLCPKHHKPWRAGRYGGYCTARDESGPKGYCEQKAPDGWTPA